MYCQSSLETSPYKFQNGKDGRRSSGEPLTHGLTCHGHPNESTTSGPFFLVYHRLNILDVVLLVCFYPWSSVVCK